MRPAGPVRVGYRTSTARQREALATDLGFDDGGRYALVAVSGYTIGEGPDDFGTVFSIIDCATGDEVEQSPVTPVSELRATRRTFIARVMHLNGKEDVYAA